LTPDMATNPLLSAIDGLLEHAPAGPRCVLAFSGGLDSSVLLHALAADRRARQQGLRAVHVHHGWSPLADAWVGHCENYAARWSVPLLSLRVQMDRGDGTGLEAQARRARYAALAAELHADEVLLTAQHADDQVETVLLKLLRGSGLDGLAGMRARARVHGVRVWRPLLAVPRSVLLAYAREHALQWLDDPSNTDPRLTRAWLRAQVLPVLQRRFPQLTQTLVHSTRFLSDDAALVQQLTGAALARCVLLDPRALNIEALLGQVAELRLRILLGWLHALDLPAPPVRLLQQMLVDLRRLAADREPLWQYANVRLQRYRQVLYASTDFLLPQDWSQDWDGTRRVLPFGLGELELIVGAAPVDRPANPDLQFPRWRLRARQGGERMHVRGVRRSLKKLLQELAVPPWQRGRLVLLFEVIADGNEVLRAVLGVVLDDAFRERSAAAGWRLLWRQDDTEPSEPTGNGGRSARSSARQIAIKTRGYRTQ
jgi:tRNA(Ile)-lysidine synthase